jgi:DNA polymerase zeta
MDDPRAEPQYGERVPYVVKAGPPGSRLIDRVVSLEEMVKDKYFALYIVAD